MAHDNGYNIGQFLILAAYNAVVDNWEAETHDQIKTKFDSLYKIEQIIVNTDRLHDIIDVIDMTTQRKLQRILNIEALEKISEISDDEAKDEALKQF